MKFEAVLKEIKPLTCKGNYDLPFLIYRKDGEWRVNYLNMTDGAAEKTLAEYRERVDRNAMLFTGEDFIHEKYAFIYDKIFYERLCLEASSWDFASDETAAFLENAEEIISTLSPETAEYLMNIDNPLDFLDERGLTAKPEDINLVVGKIVGQKFEKCALDIDVQVEAAKAGDGNYDLRRAFYELAEIHGEDTAVKTLGVYVAMNKSNSRFSLANRGWAKIYVGTEEAWSSIKYCPINTHPTILNELVDEVRELQEQAEAENFKAKSFPLPDRTVGLEEMHDFGYWGRTDVGDTMLPRTGVSGRLNPLLRSGSR